MSGELTDEQRNVRRAAHSTLQKVTDDLGRRRVFNTAIAAVMEFMNTLSKFEDQSPQARAVRQEALEFVVQMLSPIVPHAGHVLWQALGHTDPLIDHAWPQPDAAALVRDSIDVVIQVNGKLRSRITVEAGATEKQDSRWPRWLTPTCAEVDRGRTGPQSDRGEGQAGQRRDLTCGASLAKISGELAGALLPAAWPLPGD